MKKKDEEAKDEIYKTKQALQKTKSDLMTAQKSLNEVCTAFKKMYSNYY